MSLTLNRTAYEKLIAEDLEWLLTQPRTLERDHVIQIVEHSAELLYGKRQRELLCHTLHGFGATPVEAMRALRDQVNAGDADSGREIIKISDPVVSDRFEGITDPLLMPELSPLAGSVPLSRYTATVMLFFASVPREPDKA